MEEKKIWLEPGATKIRNYHIDHVDRRIDRRIYHIDRRIDRHIIFSKRVHRLIDHMDRRICHIDRHIDFNIVSNIVGNDTWRLFVDHVDHIDRVTLNYILATPCTPSYRPYGSSYADIDRPIDGNIASIIVANCAFDNKNYLLSDSFHG